MSIALFAHPGVFAPLQNLFRWLTSGQSLTPSGESSRNFYRNRSGDKGNGGGVNAARQSNSLGLDHGQVPFTPQFVANYGHTTGTDALKGTQMTLNRSPRALRIVRLFEANQAPSSAGQMAMSGRMADVCAELDRLAAREATR